ncbi:phBC6A51 family helix-turn-helix protein [Staphylococcus pasteuri]|uniref:phBC6A51 family helix-turn-helix protein n=1 Tax=Staphylococcus pasteuri TaxID=45972 RepID=UPI001E3C520E|nr:phBC6A51 family helix-turn-helix protein [Staphylococcus pasteuri]MCE3023140.1 helix-turn-helix domain-containing protein [Staphylococcus pasteuri]
MITKHKRIRPEQYVAIRYFAQPGNGGLTVEEIAKEEGVSRQTVNRWRHQPHFQAELQRQIALNTLEELPKAIEVLTKESVYGRDAIEAVQLSAKALISLVDALREEDNVTSDWYTC